MLILSCYNHSISNIRQIFSTFQIPFLNSATPRTIDEYLKLYYSISLLNISSCQIYQPNYKPLSSNMQNSLFIATNTLQNSNLPNGFHSIGTLLTSSPIELCDYSINLLTNDPIPLIRKGIILSYLKR